MLFDRCGPAWKGSVARAIRGIPRESATTRFQNCSHQVAALRRQDTAGLSAIAIASVLDKVSGCASATPFKVSGCARATPFKGKSVSSTTISPRHGRYAESAAIRRIGAWLGGS